jgi:hypothetical protein
MRSSDYTRRLFTTGGSAQIARERLMQLQRREGTRPGLPAYTPPTDTSHDLLRTLLGQGAIAGKARP